MAKIDSTSTFSERLIEALDYKGIIDPEQQVNYVAKASGVTLRTAKKYLQASRCNIRSLAFGKLARALEADFTWLYNSNGYSPKVMFVARTVDSMSEWERKKFMRLMIRLQNNNKKAKRLGNMCLTGQISPNQFLAMM